MLPHRRPCETGAAYLEKALANPCHKSAPRPSRQDLVDKPRARGGAPGPSGLLMSGALDFPISGAPDRAIKSGFLTLTRVKGE